MVRPIGKVDITIDLYDVDEDALKLYIQTQYSPESIFSQKDLELWAEDNGFVREN